MGSPPSSLSSMLSRLRPSKLLRVRKAMNRERRSTRLGAIAGATPLPEPWQHRTWLLLPPSRATTSKGFFFKASVTFPVLWQKWPAASNCGSEGLPVCWHFDLLSNQATAATTSHRIRMAPRALSRQDPPSTLGRQSSVCFESCGSVF